MEWNNYGDINPIEHGGFFIKPDSKEFPRCYYAVTVDKLAHEEDHWLLQDLYIDLNNDWYEWDSVNSYADLDENSSDIDKVIALVHYYGGEEFGQVESFLSESELIEELKLYGIEIN